VCMSALPPPPPTGGCEPLRIFIKVELWERWISIIGGAGTAFLCVKCHFHHWARHYSTFSVSNIANTVLYVIRLRGPVR